MSRYRSILARGILFALTLLIGLFGVAASKSAQVVENPRGAGAYVEAELGLIYVPDLDVTNGADGKYDLEEGYSVGLAAGWRFSEYLRLEGHFSYRDAEVDNLSLRSTPTNGRGDLGAFAFLSNVYFDLYRSAFVLTPFVGAGLGFAVVRVDTQDGLGGLEADDDSVQFAWNVMSGFAIPIGDRFDIVARYRYFATEDADVDASGTATTSSSVDVEFEAHEALAGVRFTF